jgi:hypothetical protein
MANLLTYRCQLQKNVICNETGPAVVLKYFEDGKETLISLKDFTIWSSLSWTPTHVRHMMFPL